MATANTGQGKAGGSIHTPGNIMADTGGTMHGRAIGIPDAPSINGSANPPYPPVREVKLGAVNDQEF